MNHDSSNLLEAISWRIVSELHRRFPKRWYIIETHPCSGQYDCLTLVVRGRNPVIELTVNRPGSIHVHVDAPDSGRDDTPWADWVEPMTAGRGPAFLDQVCQALQVRPPVKLPPTTRASLCYRMIAEFLSHSVGRVERWECRNGYLDSSEGSAVMTDWFDAFPSLKDALRSAKSTDLLGVPAYRYWFLCRHDEPRFCIDVDARIHLACGETVDGWVAYSKTRRAWAPLMGAVSDCLP